MTSFNGYPVTLVMRSGLQIRSDHVETMFQLGLQIHLLTEDTTAKSDPRYASVTIVSPDTEIGELVERIVRLLKSTGSQFAVTFLETDIVAVGRANERHGVTWSRPAADETARDKARQRAHLRASGCPSPVSVEITEMPVSASVFDLTGTPCIVKPTRANRSWLVELVKDISRLHEVLESIHQLAISGERHFYDEGTPATWALVEEYLPGEEITCDGVVVDGQFFLGGIHSKELVNPPWFEEDLYTLPYGDIETEAEISAVMDVLTRTLDLRAALVNAEFRRAADGQFKVVEFSTRISGGHVYRNIRDVHNVDLVRIFIEAAAGRTDTARELAAARHPGRLATCIKFLYRSGLVIENSIGDAIRDPAFRQYYQLARKGQQIRCAPDGFDICGIVSVWGPYIPQEHPSGIRETAAKVAGQLNVDIKPFTSDGEQPAQPTETRL